MPQNETLDNMDPKLFGLGDKAVDEAHYKRHLKTQDALRMGARGFWDLAPVPEFDARTRGWVTPAKNQGQCGSCWAHAAVGTIESRILKDGGVASDLSEQQQVSCNSGMSGCCGGNGTSLLFYYTNKPLLASSAPYAEGGTSCPVQRTKNCTDIHGTPVNYLANGYYTVDSTVEAMKTSLTTHGPSYFRYDMWSDFYNFWSSGTPGAVYKQSTGSNLGGGHAVLLIGWSESKQAWLLKNSWGPSTGMNGDGTFWMAYNGHSHDLHFQMFNITDLVATS